MKIEMNEGASNVAIVICICLVIGVFVHSCFKAVTRDAENAAKIKMLQIQQEVK